MTGKIKFPRHRLLRCRRPTYSPVPTCYRTTFSATIQLRQSDHRTNISYKKVYFSYDCGPIPSYDFTHDAPRRFDENSSVETQRVAPRYKSLASPSPFFGPNRNMAAGWLKAAVGPKSAPEIRHRCQGVAARYKIACSPACSPPLFRSQPDHGPNLAQSYSRNNTNTMRADT